MSPWIIYFLSSAEFVSSELKLFSFWLFEPLTVSNCSNTILRVPCSDDSCKKSYHFVLYQANPFHLLDSIQCIFVPSVIYLESILNFLLQGEERRETIYMVATRNQMSVSNFKVFLDYARACFHCLELSQALQR